MVDGVCLINFNARIYDPSIGRFTAADPIVGDETVPQELNRYSYVLNDPLSLTDPSGLCGVFCIFTDVLDVLAIFYPPLLPLDQVVNEAAQFVAIAENPEQGVLGILVGDGLAQLILTGNIKEFALNAFEAGLFYESGNLLQKEGQNGFLGLGHDASKFIAHGLVGGLISELRSNNFASGFLAGGLSSLAPLRIGQMPLDSEMVEREASALGGIGSVLGGGKFDNGAQTGAFGYLFNCLPHECLAHYVNGSGKSLNENFSELGADKIGPNNFPEYESLISDPGLPDRTYNISDKFVFYAKGSLASAAAYGHVILDLNSNLSVSQGDFTFYGTVSAEPDLYDFDPRPWGIRTFLGELSTRAGSLLPGKPYYNNFQGNKPVFTRGTIH